MVYIRIQWAKNVHFQLFNLYASAKLRPNDGHCFNASQYVHQFCPLLQLYYFKRQVKILGCQSVCDNHTHDFNFIKIYFLSNFNLLLRSVTPLPPILPRCKTELSSKLQQKLPAKSTQSVYWQLLPVKLHSSHATLF